MADPKNSPMYGSGGPMRSTGSSSHRPTPYERNGRQKPRGFFGVIQNAFSSFFGGGSSSSNDTYSAEDQNQYRAPPQPVPATPQSVFSPPPKVNQPSSPKEALEKVLPPKISEHEAQELFAVISSRMSDVAPPPRVATLPVPKPQVVRSAQQNVARPVARMQPAPVTPHDVAKLVMDKRSPERAAYRQQVAARASNGHYAGEHYRDPSSAFRTPHRFNAGVGTTVVPPRYESTPAPGGYFYRPGGANATPRVQQDADEEAEPVYYQAGPSSANPRKRYARRSPPREIPDASEYIHAYDRPPVKRRAVDANRSYVAASPIHMSTQAQKIFNSIEKMSTPFLEPAPVVTSHKVAEFYRDRHRELSAKSEELELPPATSVIPPTSAQKKRKRETEMQRPPTYSPWANEAEEDDSYTGVRKTRKIGEESKVATAMASDFKAPLPKTGSFGFKESDKFKSVMSGSAPKRDGSKFPLAPSFSSKSAVAIDVDDEEMEEEEEADNDFEPAADEEEDEEIEEDEEDEDEAGNNDEDDDVKVIPTPKSVFSAPKDAFAPPKGSPFSADAKKDEKPKEATSDASKTEKPAFSGFTGSFATASSDKSDSKKEEKSPFGAAPFGSSFSATPAFSLAEKKDAKADDKPIFSTPSFDSAPGAAFGGFKFAADKKDESEKEKKEKEEKEKKEKEEKEKKEKEEKEKKEKEEREKKEKEEKEKKEKEEKERIEKEKREAEEKKKETEKKKEEDAPKATGFSFAGAFDASKSSVLSNVYMDDVAFKAPVTSGPLSSVALRLDAPAPESFDKTKISFGVPAPSTSPPKAAPSTTALVAPSAAPLAFGLGAAAPASTPASSQADKSESVDASSGGSMFKPLSSSVFGFGGDTKSAPEKDAKTDSPVFTLSASKPEAKEEKKTALPTSGFGTTLGGFGTTLGAKKEEASAEAKAPEKAPEKSFSGFSTPAIFGTDTAKDATSKSLTTSSAFMSKDSPAAPATGNVNPFAAPATGSVNPFAAPATSTTPSAAPLFGGASLGNPFEKKGLDAPLSFASNNTPAPAAAGFGNTTLAAPSFGNTSAPAGPAFGNAPAASPFGKALDSAPSFATAPGLNTQAPSFGNASAGSGGFGNGFATQNSGFSGGSGASGFNNATPNPFDSTPSQSFGTSTAAGFSQPATQAPFGGASAVSNPFGGSSSTPAPTAGFGNPAASGFGGNSFGGSQQQGFGDAGGFGGATTTPGGFAAPFGNTAAPSAAPSFGGASSFANSPFGNFTTAAPAPSGAAFAMGAGDSNETKARKKYKVKK